MEVDSGFDFEFIRPDQVSKCTWTVNSHKQPVQQKQCPHASIRKVRGKVSSDVLSLVGETPVIRLNRIPKMYGLECDILVKCEFLNPGGSLKDRIALRMIEEAEAAGKIKPGDTLIEPTSGNTGIGLALACAVKGYRCIIVMPQKMSAEKECVVRALGAEVVRTPTAAAFDAPNSNFAVAQKLAHNIPNSHVLDQFRNPGNPLAHYDHTAMEILSQTEGKCDMIVMGAGTGGAVCGIGRRFKETLPSCVICCVDPEFSTLAPGSTNTPGFYEVEGIGYDFVPTVLDRSIVDHWVKTEDKESFVLARELIMYEGLLCGGSSGSAMIGAIKAIKELRIGKGKTVVVVLPDGVRNYMTKFLNDGWMSQRGFPIPGSEKTDSTPGSDNSSNRSFMMIPISNITDGMNLTTVNEMLRVSEAIAMMRQQGFDQLPVVHSDTGLLIGMVTVDDLMVKLSSGSIKGTTPLSAALSQNFPKMPLNSTIGSLSRMLKNTQFVVIVDSMDGEGSQRVKGILTHIDILNYLIEIEGNEQ
jgi:cystathionine beta-synthase